MVPPAVWARARRAVAGRIEQFDRDYSRFRADSLVSAMARTAGRYQLPPDAQPLFDLYRELYDLTAGAVTPLVGGLLAAAGYDAAYSLRPGTLTPPPAWPGTLRYEFPHLTLARPVSLDLGAAGKGYLVDLVAGVLRTHGITAYCVDAGGDMAHQGALEADPLAVGLEHPADAGQVIGVAQLRNQSLCGSAGNRRAWAGLNHIIDPHTRTSPTHLRAVWAVADTTLLADALTTALYFVPPPILAAHYVFEYALVYEDFSLEHSADFPAAFFTTPAISAL